MRSTRRGGLESETGNEGSERKKWETRLTFTKDADDQNKSAPREQIWDGQPENLEQCIVTSRDELTAAPVDGICEGTAGKKHRLRTASSGYLRRSLEMACIKRSTKGA